MDRSKESDFDLNAKNKLGFTGFQWAVTGDFFREKNKNHCQNFSKVCYPSIFKQY